MAGTVDLDLYAASLQVRAFQPIASQVGFDEQELRRLGDLLGRPQLAGVALTPDEATEASTLLARLAPSVPLDRWPTVPEILARAHDALRALTGPATGRPPDASAAAVLHGPEGAGGFILLDAPVASSGPGEVEEIETGAGLLGIEFHPPIDTNVVAVMGAGKMGSDIAYALLSAGFTVRIYDSDPKKTGAI